MTAAADEVITIFSRPGFALLCYKLVNLSKHGRSLWAGLKGRWGIVTDCDSRGRVVVVGSDAV
jgi:hypothetical protein